MERDPSGRMPGMGDGVDRAWVDLHEQVEKNRFINFVTIRDKGLPASELGRGRSP